MPTLNEKIKSVRVNFSTRVLDQRTISKNPLAQFKRWMEDAFNAGISEPNAMTLATVTEDGFADARIVLLRDCNSKGFSFFTNYRSAKGNEIRKNKKACLNFFWPDVHRQVRIRGMLQKVSARESDRYFASRPRESQIGAWASHQSESLSGRDELLERYNKLDEKFSGIKIPRPPHWGGYVLKPVYFEFWQGQTNRLHDRISYRKSGTAGWKIVRLNP